MERVFSPIFLLGASYGPVRLMVRKKYGNKTAIWKRWIPGTDFWRKGKKNNLCHHEEKIDNLFKQQKVTLNRSPPLSEFPAQPGAGRGPWGSGRGRMEPRRSGG